MHKLALYGNRDQMSISALEVDGMSIKVCCQKLALNHLNRAKVEKMFTLERMVKEYRYLFDEVLDTR